MKLFPHQKEALRHLHNGSILCGGVGTGKSTTSLAYYVTHGGDARYSDDDVYTPPTYLRQLVIITTAKKRDSKEWDVDLGRFGLSRDKDSTACGMMPIVDSWNNIKKYVNWAGCFFIFDEQRLTGKGAWVKTFLKIANKNKWILLSATPGDVWIDYIPVFVANGFYKNRSEFMFRHVRLDPRVKNYPKIIGYFDEDILRRHQKEVMVIMLYEKPAIAHHVDIEVGYDAEAYWRVWKERKDPKTGKPFKQIAGLLSCLRQITNTDASRVQAVKQICEKRGRVIIFYNFNYELDLLREMCESLGATYSEWNGQKHEEIADSPRWIYLVQYNAGAEGWECIETNTVVFYSQSYSYRATTQAAGRIDRLTTPFTDLYFFHVKSQSPIDKGITQALNRKEEFNEKAFIKEMEEKEYAPF